MACFFDGRDKDPALCGDGGVAAVVVVAVHLFQKYGWRVVEKGGVWRACWRGEFGVYRFCFAILGRDGEGGISAPFSAGG